MPLNKKKSLVFLTGIVLFSGCQKDEKSDPVDVVNEGSNLCTSELADECASLEVYVAEQTELQQASLQNYDMDQLLSHSIEIDHATSMKDLYRKGFSNGSVPVEQEKARYQFMKALANPDFNAVGDFSNCSAGAECEAYQRQNQALRTRLEALQNQGSEEAVRLRVNTNLTVLKANNSSQSLLVDRAYASVMSFLANAERLMVTGTSAVDTSVIDPAQCPKELQAQCFATFEKIGELNQQRIAALASNDDSALTDLSLEINYHYDILQTLTAGNGPESTEYQKVEKRYYALRVISLSGLKGYSLEEQNEVRKVTERYGDLKIGTTLDDSGEAQWVDTELEQEKPWSGYWYPFRYQDMFNGLASDSFKKESSPLEVFDQILVSLGREPGAAAWEKKRFQSNAWESSDGLCDAWSVAAALSREPDQSVEYQGVELSPAHIKGLLVQKYSNYKKERFGISYQGFIETDGLGQDLRPEAFHQLVTKMIEEGKAPVVDTDPNFPIWNMPMYKYEWKIKKDPNIANALLVTARPWFVKFRNQETNELTNYNVGRESNLYIPTYKYRLYHDGSETGETKTIIYGEWILDDVAGEHPDTVFMVNEGEEENIGPRNPFVAENMDVLNEIVLQFQ